MWLSVGCPSLCYGSYCEKLKSMCENLEAVYSSDVDGTQLHEEIQDCKMIVSRQVERIAL